MIRKVLKPLKLPDGTVLPVGTILGVDTRNAVLQNSTLENPYEFDGFRCVVNLIHFLKYRLTTPSFEKLRALNGNENRYQVREQSYSAI